MNSKCAKPTFGSQYFKPIIWFGILAHGCVQLHPNAPPAMDPMSANLSCDSTKYHKTSIIYGNYDRFNNYTVGMIVTNVHDAMADEYESHCCIT